MKKNSCRVGCHRTCTMCNTIAITFYGIIFRRDIIFTSLSYSMWPFVWWLNVSGRSLILCTWTFLATKSGQVHEVAEIEFAFERWFSKKEEVANDWYVLVAECVLLALLSGLDKLYRCRTCPETRKKNTPAKSFIICRLFWFFLQISIDHSFKCHKTIAWNLLIYNIEIRILKNRFSLHLTLNTKYSLKLEFIIA